MGNVAKFTVEEVSIMLSIIAGLNPDNYIDSEVKATIHKVKASYDKGYDWLRIVR